MNSCSVILFQSFTLGNAETSTLLPLEKMFGRGNAIIKSLPAAAAGPFPAEVPIFMVGGAANYGGPQAGPNYSPITQGHNSMEMLTLQRLSLKVAGKL